LRVPCDLELEVRSTKLVSKGKGYFPLLTIYRCGNHSQKLERKLKKNVKNGCFGDNIFGPCDLDLEARSSHHL
jgi:hypothetical protein